MAESKLVGGKSEADAILAAVKRGLKDPVPEVWKAVPKRPVLRIKKGKK